MPGNNNTLGMLAPVFTSDRANILLSSAAVCQDINVSLGPVAMPCWIHQDGSNAIMDSPVPPLRTEVKQHWGQDSFQMADRLGYLGSEFDDA